MMRRVLNLFRPIEAPRRPLLAGVLLPTPREIAEAEAVATHKPPEVRPCTYVEPERIWIGGKVKP